MWRPLERIRHDSEPAVWPTAEAAAISRLFSPIRVGPLVLAHRTWVPAMVPWRATEEGEVTPEVLGWYERFARGRPAALVVEATGIRDVPSGPLLRIGHDRFIPGLAELVRVVRSASAGADAGSSSRSSISLRSGAGRIRQSSSSATSPSRPRTARHLARCSDGSRRSPLARESRCGCARRCADSSRIAGPAAGLSRARD